MVAYIVDLGYINIYPSYYWYFVYFIHVYLIQSMFIKVIHRATLHYIFVWENCSKFERAEMTHWGRKIHSSVSLSVVDESFEDFHKTDMTCFFLPICKHNSMPLLSAVLINKHGSAAFSCQRIKYLQCVLTCFRLWPPTHLPPEKCVN